MWHLCVGSDMLLTFQKWYRWQDMLKMAALVVESRTGTDRRPPCTLPPQN